MKYAVFNDLGFPVGFYDLEIHGDKIPTDAIEITDEQWREFIENQGLRRWDGTNVVQYVPPTPDPEPVVTVVPSVTLWERVTNEEAEQIKVAMATQSFRINQIFLTANTFRSDHELWPHLETMATQLFGEARAAELLAP